MPYVNEKLWDSRCKIRDVSRDFGRILTSDMIYEPSACDVLDAGYDFVFNGASLMYRDATIQSWLYWTICILVIFLVRCLSKYILFSLNKQGRGDNGGGTVSTQNLPNSWVCVAVSVATIVLATYQGDSCFVTEEDLVFYWFTFAYTVFYALLFVSVRMGRYLFRVESFHDPPFYNLLVGVFQLVACRFYFSALTPYTLPIVAVIAVRIFVKSRRRCGDMIRGITLLFDGFMLSLLCVFSFWEAKEYLVALVCVSMAWADYLVG